jgi:hypothetical protein
MGMRVRLVCLSNVERKCENIIQRNAVAVGMQKEMIEAKENKENDKLKAYVKSAGGRSVFAMDISFVGGLLIRYA